MRGTKRPTAGQGNFLEDGLAALAEFSCNWDTPESVIGQSSTALEKKYVSARISRMVDRCSG